MNFNPKLVIVYHFDVFRNKIDLKTEKFSCNQNLNTNDSHILK